MSQINSGKVLRPQRKVQIGKVVSDRMDKTRIIVSAWSATHSKYHKVVKRFSRFHAHDEQNASHTGDVVEIMETRPLSKLKRWRIIKVVEKAQ